MEASLQISVAQSLASRPIPMYLAPAAALVHAATDPFVSAAQRVCRNGLPRPCGWWPLSCGRQGGERISTHARGAAQQALVDAYNTLECTYRHSSCIPMADGGVCRCRSASGSEETTGG